jgi:preprotein translocase subunit SecG
LEFSSIDTEGIVVGVVEIIGGMLLIPICILIVTVVTLQETKGGLGSIAGETPSFFDKNRGKTKEAILVRATTVAGIAMAVITLIVVAVLH